MTRNHKYNARGGWYDKNLRYCMCPTCMEKRGAFFPGNNNQCVITLPENERYYFRSIGEVESARNFELQRRAGHILLWEYEPEVWDFNTRLGPPWSKRTKPYTANSSILVDFRITPGPRLFMYAPDGSKQNIYHVEYKGYLTKAGATKIRRAVKHFPERVLLVSPKVGEYIPAAEYLERMKRK